MNWSAFIDSYCERLLPGFWDEPLNAISNVAFWLAAWLVWQAWQHVQSADLAFASPRGGGDIKALLGA